MGGRGGVQRVEQKGALTWAAVGGVVTSASGWGGRLRCDQGGGREQGCTEEDFGLHDF